MVLWFLLAIGLLALAFAALRLRYAAPRPFDRTPDAALPPSPDTRLAQALASHCAAHPGKSGVLELRDGSDALSARLHLIDNADHAIDVQYYIWKDDSSGRLMLQALIAAARRGVKVRMLLDDNGVPGLDGLLGALDREPNVRVRLFNPSMIRNPKIVGYALDFMRMNRRMHNKALIVDGVAAIVGGRNIADVYFGVGDMLFVDLDVLAVGDIVGDVSGEFNAYWNSASAIDASAVLPAPAGDIDHYASRPSPDIRDDRTALSKTRYEDFARRLRDAPPQFEWANTQVLYDDPSKGLGKARGRQLLITRLVALAGTPQSHIELVSPYFVPGRRGLRYFGGAARAGARVRVLTNSAAATDVLLVHSGYRKYRRRLLRSGVELYELKRTGPMRHRRKDVDIKDFATSSGASLHAKTFAIDGRRMFIGSYNFDPRSALLNCEMGIMIDSPKMASQLGSTFATQLATHAYRPKLDGLKMVWTEPVAAGGEKHFEKEPDTTLTQRLFVRVGGWLPIEWLL